MNVTEISIYAEIDVPIKLAWELWHTPIHIKEWYTASEEWATSEAENNFKEGGKFSYRMEAKDGTVDFDFSGKYDKIENHRFISYTLDDGRKVDVRFRKTDTDTIIIQKFQPETENPLKIQKEGWQAILNNFKRYAQKFIE